MEIRSRRRLKEFCPTWKDKGSYQLVVCPSGILEGFSSASRPLLMVEYEEQLMKVCFLSGNNLVIEAEGIMSTERERNGWGRLPWTEDGRTKISSLRMERIVNDCGFTLLEKHPVGSAIRYIARRMPKIFYGDVFDGIKRKDTIFEVPVALWDDFFSQLSNQKKKGIVWKKQAKVDWMSRSFYPWLYVPLMFCRICNNNKGGIHRIAVARRRKKKTIEARVMECWWKGERSCFGRRKDVKKKI